MTIVNSDIIFWYDIDEGSGTVLTDESGNGDDATITNASWSTGSGITNVDEFLDFDGLNDYWQVDSALAAMFSAGAQSISFWIRFDDVTDNMLYGTNDIGNTTSIQAYIEDNATEFWAAPASSTNRLKYNTSNINTGVWEHWCIVFDGSGTGNSGRLKLYVNGSTASVTYSGTIGTTTTSTSGVFRWGVRTGGTGGFDFNGGLAQIAIFNKALTSTEVGDIYNSGAGTTYASLLGGGGGVVKPEYIGFAGM